CGFICDRVGSRRLLGYGIIGSAAATAAFGGGQISAVFALSFGINGIMQSAGWPGAIKALTPYFVGRDRGLFMGIWSTCYQVGGLAGVALATFLLTHYG